MAESDARRSNESLQSVSSLSSVSSVSVRIQQMKDNVEAAGVTDGMDGLVKEIDDLLESTSYDAEEHIKQQRLSMIKENLRHMTDEAVSIDARIRGCSVKVTPDATKESLEKSRVVCKDLIKMIRDLESSVQTTCKEVESVNRDRKMPLETRKELRADALKVLEYYANLMKELKKLRKRLDHLYHEKELGIFEVLKGKVEEVDEWLINNINMYENFVIIYGTYKQLKEAISEIKDLTKRIAETWKKFQGIATDWNSELCDEVKDEEYADVLDNVTKKFKTLNDITNGLKSTGHRMLLQRKAEDDVITKLSSWNLYVDEKEAAIKAAANDNENFEVLIQGILKEIDEKNADVDKFLKNSNETLKKNTYDGNEVKRIESTLKEFTERWNKLKVHITRVKTIHVKFSIWKEKLNQLNTWLTVTTAKYSNLVIDYGTYQHLKGVSSQIKGLMKIIAENWKKFEVIADEWNSGLCEDVNNAEHADILDKTKEMFVTLNGVANGLKSLVHDMMQQRKAEDVITAELSGWKDYAVSKETALGALTNDPEKANEKIEEILKDIYEKDPEADSFVQASYETLKKNTYDANEVKQIDDRIKEFTDQWERLKAQIEKTKSTEDKFAIWKIKVSEIKRWLTVTITKHQSFLMEYGHIKDIEETNLQIKDLIEEIADTWGSYQMLADEWSSGLCEEVKDQAYGDVLDEIKGYFINVENIANSLKLEGQGMFEQRKAEDELSATLRGWKSYANYKEEELVSVSSGPENTHEQVEVIWKELTEKDFDVNKFLDTSSLTLKKNTYYTNNVDLIEDRLKEFSDQWNRLRIEAEKLKRIEDEFTIWKVKVNEITTWLTLTTTKYSKLVINYGDYNHLRETEAQIKDLMENIVDTRKTLEVISTEWNSGLLEEKQDQNQINVLNENKVKLDALDAETNRLKSLVLDMIEQRKAEDDLSATLIGWKKYADEKEADLKVVSNDPEKTHEKIIAILVEINERNPNVDSFLKESRATLKHNTYDADEVKQIEDKLKDFTNQWNRLKIQTTTVKSTEDRFAIWKVKVNEIKTWLISTTSKHEVFTVKYGTYHHLNEINLQIKDFIKDILENWKVFEAKADEWNSGLCDEVKDQKYADVLDEIKGMFVNINNITNGLKSLAQKMMKQRKAEDDLSTKLVGWKTYADDKEVDLIAVSSDPNKAHAQVEVILKELTEKDSGVNEFLQASQTTLKKNTYDTDAVKLINDRLKEFSDQWERLRIKAEKVKRIEDKFSIWKIKVTEIKTWLTVTTTKYSKLLIEYGDYHHLREAELQIKDLMENITDTRKTLEVIFTEWNSGILVEKQDQNQIDVLNENKVKLDALDAKANRLKSLVLDMIVQRQAEDDLCSTLEGWNEYVDEKEDYLKALSNDPDTKHEKIIALLVEINEKNHEVDNFLEASSATLKNNTYDANEVKQIDDKIKEFSDQWNRLKIQTKTVKSTEDRFAVWKVKVDEIRTWLISTTSRYEGFVLKYGTQNVIKEQHETMKELMKKITDRWETFDDLADEWNSGLCEKVTDRRYSDILDDTKEMFDTLNVNVDRLETRGHYMLEQKKEEDEFAEKLSIWKDYAEGKDVSLRAAFQDPEECRLQIESLIKAIHNYDDNVESFVEESYDILIDNEFNAVEVKEYKEELIKFKNLWDDLKVVIAEGQRDIGDDITESLQKWELTLGNFDTELITLIQKYPDPINKYSNIENILSVIDKTELLVHDIEDQSKSVEEFEVKSNSVINLLQQDHKVALDKQLKRFFSDWRLLFKRSEDLLQTLTSRRDILLKEEEDLMQDWNKKHKLKDEWLDGVINEIEVFAVPSTEFEDIDKYMNTLDELGNKINRETSSLDECIEDGTRLIENERLIFSENKETVKEDADMLREKKKKISKNLLLLRNRLMELRESKRIKNEKEREVISKISIWQKRLEEHTDVLDSCEIDDTPSIVETQIVIDNLTSLIGSLRSDDDGLKTFEAYTRRILPILQADRTTSLNMDLQSLLNSWSHCKEKATSRLAMLKLKLSQLQKYEEQAITQWNIKASDIISQLNNTDEKISSISKHEDRLEGVKELEDITELIKEYENVLQRVNSLEETVHRQMAIGQDLVDSNNIQLPENQKKIHADTSLFDEKFTIVSENITGTKMMIQDQSERIFQDILENLEKTYCDYSNRSDDCDVKEGVGIEVIAKSIKDLEALMIEAKENDKSLKEFEIDTKPLINIQEHKNGKQLESLKQEFIISCKDLEERNRSLLHELKNRHNKLVEDEEKLMHDWKTKHVETEEWLDNVVTEVEVFAAPDADFDDIDAYLAKLDEVENKVNNQRNVVDDNINHANKLDDRFIFKENKETMKNVINAFHNKKTKINENILNAKTKMLELRDKKLQQKKNQDDINLSLSSWKKKLQDNNNTLDKCNVDDIESIYALQAGIDQLVELNDDMASNENELTKFATATRELINTLPAENCSSFNMDLELFLSNWYHCKEKVSTRLAMSNLKIAQLQKYEDQAIGKWKAKMKKINAQINKYEEDLYNIGDCPDDVEATTKFISTFEDLSRGITKLEQYIDKQKDTGKGLIESNSIQLEENIQQIQKDIVSFERILTILSNKTSSEKYTIEEQAERNIMKVVENCITDCNNDSQKINTFDIEEHNDIEKLVNMINDVEVLSNEIKQKEAYVKESNTKANALINHLPYDSGMKLKDSLQSSYKQWEEVEQKAESVLHRLKNSHNKLLEDEERLMKDWNKKHKTTEKWLDDVIIEIDVFAGVSSTDYDSIDHYLKRLDELENRINSEKIIVDESIENGTMLTDGEHLILNQNKKSVIQVVEILRRKKGKIIDGIANSKKILMKMRNKRGLQGENEKKVRLRLDEWQKKLQEKNDVLDNCKTNEKSNASATRKSIDKLNTLMNSFHSDEDELSKFDDSTKKLTKTLDAEKRSSLNMDLQLFLNSWTHCKEKCEARLDMLKLRMEQIQKYEDHTIAEWKANVLKIHSKLEDVAKELSSLDAEDVNIKNVLVYATRYKDIIDRVNELEESMFKQKESGRELVDSKDIEIPKNVKKIKSEITSFDKRHSSVSKIMVSTRQSIVNDVERMLVRKLKESDKMYNNYTRKVDSCDVKEPPLLQTLENSITQLEVLIPELNEKESNINELVTNSKSVIELIQSVDGNNLKDRLQSCLRKWYKLTSGSDTLLTKLRTRRNELLDNEEKLMKGWEGKHTVAKEWLDNVNAEINIIEAPETYLDDICGYLNELDELDKKVDSDQSPVDDCIENGTNLAEGDSLLFAENRELVQYAVNELRMRKKKLPDDLLSVRRMLSDIMDGRNLQERNENEIQSLLGEWERKLKHNNDTLCEYEMKTPSNISDSQSLIEQFTTLNNSVNDEEEELIKFETTVEELNAALAADKSNCMKMKLQLFLNRWDHYKEKVTANLTNSKMKLSEQLKYEAYVINEWNTNVSQTKSRIERSVKELSSYETFPDESKDMIIFMKKYNDVWITNDLEDIVVQQQKVGKDLVDSMKIQLPENVETVQDDCSIFDDKLSLFSKKIQRTKELMENQIQKVLLSELKEREKICKEYNLKLDDFDIEENADIQTLAEAIKDLESLSPDIKEKDISMKEFNMNSNALIDGLHPTKSGIIKGKLQLIYDAWKEIVERSESALRRLRNRHNKLVEDEDALMHDWKTKHVETEEWLDNVVTEVEVFAAPDTDFDDIDAYLAKLDEVENKVKTEESLVRSNIDHGNELTEGKKLIFNKNRETIINVIENFQKKKTNINETLEMAKRRMLELRDQRLLLKKNEEEVLTNFALWQKILKHNTDILDKCELDVSLSATDNQKYIDLLEKLIDDINNKDDDLVTFELTLRQFTETLKGEKAIYLKMDMQLFLKSWGICKEKSASRLAMLKLRLNELHNLEGYAMNEWKANVTELLSRCENVEQELSSHGTEPPDVKDIMNFVKKTEELSKKVTEIESSIVKRKNIGADLKVSRRIQSVENQKRIESDITQLDEKLLLLSKNISMTTKFTEEHTRETILKSLADCKTWLPIVKQRSHFNAEVASDIETVQKQLKEIKLIQSQAINFTDTIGGSVKSIKYFTKEEKDNLDAVNNELSIIRIWIRKRLVLHEKSEIIWSDFEAHKIELLNYLREIEKILNPPSGLNWVQPSTFKALCESFHNVKTGMEEKKYLVNWLAELADQLVDMIGEEDDPLSRGIRTAVSDISNLWNFRVKQSIELQTLIRASRKKYKTLEKSARRVRAWISDVEEILGQFNDDIRGERYDELREVLEEIQTEESGMKKRVEEINKGEKELSQNCNCALTEYSFEGTVITENYIYVELDGIAELNKDFNAVCNRLDEFQRLRGKARMLSRRVVSVKNDKMERLASTKKEKMEQFVAVKNEKLERLASTKKEKMEQFVAVKNEKLERLASTKREKIEQFVAAKNEKMERLRESTRNFSLRSTKKDEDEKLDEVPSKLTS